MTVHNRYIVRYMTFIGTFRFASLSTPHTNYVSPWPQSDERRDGTQAQAVDDTTNLPKRDSDVWKTVDICRRRQRAPHRAGLEVHQLLKGASVAERNWSVYGQIKTTARARMGHAVGDKLVFCHESLHLVKNKLQKASYKLQAGRREVGIRLGLGPE